MKLPAVLNSKPAQYALLGVGAYLFVVYLLPKLSQKLAQTPGNLLQGINQGLGSNDLTNNATDFSGQPVDYSGHGALSTLAAGANAASGGFLASIGEWIGDHLPVAGDVDPNAVNQAGTTRTQVVTPNYVTDLSQIF
jgi:hypothetical protein